MGMLCYNGWGRVGIVKWEAYEEKWRTNLKRDLGEREALKGK